MFEHWGNTIYWDQLTWEAFAALAAIVAAATVGWRQVGVQHRQAEIEALGIKVALRDERLKVYDATRGFIGNILTTGNVPGRQTLAAGLSGGNVTLPEVAIAFYDAMDRAKFLFAPPVRERLVHIYNLAMDLGDMRASATTFYEGEEGTNRARSQAIRDELQKIYGDVAAIFGDELVLSSSPAKRRRPSA